MPGTTFSIGNKQSGTFSPFFEKDTIADLEICRKGSRIKDQGFNCKLAYLEYDDNEAQFGQWLLVVGYAPLVLGAVLALRDVAALHLWRYTAYWRRRHPSNASEVDEQGLAETSEVRLVLPTSAEMVQDLPGGKAAPIDCRAREVSGLETSCMAG